MADDSRNPEDRASLERLNRKLEGVGNELTALANEARGEQAKTAQQADRERSRASRESAARRASPGRAAAGAQQAVPKTPAESSEVARNTERTARAEQQVTREQQRQARLRAEFGRSFTRGRLPLSAGGGRGSDPPIPPAPPVPPGGDEPPRRRYPSLPEILARTRPPVAPAPGRAVDALSEDELATVARGQAAAARGTAQLEQRLQTSTRALRMNGDELRRHGALTTEFISAAARGQVTIRELGYQVGATIGKFAGWTAAASAVYGAAAALQTLGSGAVASLEGVNQLQRILPRVDTEAAQQKFRDLAQEFNLPIEQVASTQYEMSRIFRDQGDAATAAQVALRAMSVAELDAGESTRYLSAIVKGFQLDANELPLVLDQINQATNKFGGNTGQLVEGVSKAGGQFRAAGGDVQYLISLIEAGTSLTGRTGSEIGTAIQRSAEILQRPERRAKIIDLLGIDPRDHSIEQVYEAAFKRAQGATGAQVTAIAAALSTPQLATRITPILSNRPLFEDIQKQISPENATGSAIRENDRRMKGFRETLHRVIIDLERMGSALAQSGALAPIGAMAQGLEKALNLAVRLTEAFNNLAPKELRTAAFFIAEIAAGMALMRRFNVGELVPQRFALARSSLSRNPEALQRAQVFQGIRDEREYLKGSLNAAGVDAARADDRALVAAEEQRRVYANAASTDEDRLAATRKAERLAAEAKGYEEERNRLQGRYNDNESQRKDIARRLRAGQSIAQAAPAAGVFVTNSTLERQSGRLPVGIVRGADPLAAANARAAAVGVTGATRGVRDQTAGADALTRDSKLMQLAVREQIQSHQRLGLTGRVGGALMLTGGAAVGRAGRGLQTFGRGAANFAREIAGSLGALDVALIGVGAAFALYRQMQSQIDEAARFSQGFSAPKTDLAGMQKLVDDFADSTSEIEKWQNYFADQLKMIGLPVATPNQVNAAEAAAAQSEIDTIRQVRDRGVALTGDQIKRRLDAGLKSAGSDRRARAAAIKQAEFELERSFVDIYGGDEAARRAEQTTKNYVASVKKTLAITQGGLHAALEAVGSADELATFRSNLETRIGLYGVTPKRQRAAGEGIVRARELAAQTDDPAELEKLLQEINGLKESILKDANEGLQRGLREARTPAEQGAARQAYLGDAKQAFGIPQTKRQINALTERIDGRNKAIRDAERELAAAEKQAANAPAERGPLDAKGTLGTLPDQQNRKAADNEKKKRDALEKLKVLQTADRKELEELRQQLGLSREEFKDLRREQEKAQFAAELASIQSATDVRQSRTADPVAQARLGVAGALEEYRKLQQGYHDHNVTLDELRAGEAKLNRARQQMAQAELSRFQARQGLAAAQFALGTRDAGAIARFALQQAQAYATQVQQQVAAGNADPEELTRAMTAVLDARKAVADNLRAEAEAMLSAQEAWQLSGTDDPLKQARIRAEFAARRRRETPADTAAGRLQQRADEREARRGARSAQIDDKYGDLQFEHDMGRITDQFFASELQRLSRIKGLSKEQRRRFQLEAKRLLEGDGGLELNLDNLRMPTTYEIRRALSPAGQQQPNVQVTNAPKVDVHVYSEGDVPKVIEALDLTLNTSGRSALRSSGVLR